MRAHLLAAGLAAALCSAPGLAQDDPTARPPGAAGELRAPDAGDAPRLPEKVGSAAPKMSEAEARAKAVDDLLARLSKAQDPGAAKRIASAVQALWTRSGSDTVDLLATRSAEAQRMAKLDVAIRLMSEVVELDPDFAEGWNRRATLHFLAKDYEAAMRDIHETLVREPRHFAAWAGLGRILRDSGLDKQALAAFRRAVEIYPAIDGLKQQIDELTLKVEGQPI